jgi:Abortive infection C-terminus
MAASQTKAHFIEPMLLLRTDKLPEGTNWAYELKLDGSTQLCGVQDAIVTINTPELARQLERLRGAVDDDPGLAIGTAKEMLETTCKTILEEHGVAVDPAWDVPELLKATRRQLKLLPDDIPDAVRGADTMKRLLSSLGQIGYGLAELRNLYGSGHGRSGGTKGLSPRHARLAVGAVATLVQFLFETHRDRKTP